VSKKYADTEPPRRQRRVRRSTGDLQPDRRKSSSVARERESRQRQKTGSRVRSDSPPAPRPQPSRARAASVKDPVERLIQPLPGRDDTLDPRNAGNVNWAADLQRQIDENATLALVRFEGPGVCPHCRQTVFRPWNLQFGNPPVNLYFCNAAVAELKYVLDQIKDPSKG
jgi:hypothetical protein